MGDIWNAAIVDPLTQALVALNGFLGSYGLAIIVLTLGIKLVTFPLTLQQIRSTKGMREVQPYMEEIKKKYGKDKTKLTEETMKLYKEHGVNPAAGCLPLLVQMPIWFGLYSALISLSQQSPDFAKGFLWLPSLAQPDPYYLLVILTVVTQFVVQRMMSMPSTDPQQQMMNKVMMIMPLTFGFIAMSVPSGLVLYWVTTNVFTFFQQLFTTGWGDLLPNRPRTQAPALRRPRPEAAAAVSSNGTVEQSEEDSAPRTPKAAKHKKRAGAKSSREEKRGKK